MLFLSTGLRPSTVNLRPDVCVVGTLGDQSHCFGDMGPVNFVLGPSHSNHRLLFKKKKKVSLSV